MTEKDQRLVSDLPDEPITSQNKLISQEELNTPCDHTPSKQKHEQSNKPKQLNFAVGPPIEDQDLALIEWQ